MDYDATAMPGNYDKGRSLSPEALTSWLDLVENQLSGQRLANILDLGCGTGRFAEALAARFDADVLGVDPSRKMLEEARKKPQSGRVSYANGRGESLPLADSSVDLVFMSMVFHHLESPELTARECLRVLRTPGAVCVRSPTLERLFDYAYVPFFPTTVALLRERLVPGPAIQTVFERAGFNQVYAGALLQKIAQNWRDYLEKLAYRADSILISITDAEFAEGLVRVRSHAERADPRECVIEPIDAFIFVR